MRSSAQPEENIIQIKATLAQTVNLYVGILPNLSLPPMNIDRPIFLLEPQCLI